MSLKLEPVSQYVHVPRLASSSYVLTFGLMYVLYTYMDTLGTGTDTLDVVPGSCLESPHQVELCFARVEGPHKT